MKRGISCNEIPTILARMHPVSCKEIPAFRVGTGRACVQGQVLYKTGGAQPNLNVDKIKNLKVQLPSLPTQQKIAHILFRYDEAIENNNKRIKLLEQMAQNLYKEWFVRFRFPGYENCEFENGIPVGWEYSMDNPSRFI